MNKKNNRINYFTKLLFAIAVFALGFYVLEYLSLLSLPFGQTFYVIMGSLLMAAGVVQLYFLIKEIFFKKKKKKTKIVFMNKMNEQKEIEI